MNPSIGEPKMSKRQTELLAYLGKLAAIWLSWQLIIAILGEQKEPINNRLLPWLSTVWEQFNDTLATQILAVSQTVLSAIGYTVHTYLRTIWIADTPGVTVGNYCLGIQLMYYFATMVLITPMPMGRKVLGVIGGMMLVNMLNVARISGLAIVAHHTPQYLFIAHDHIFNFLVLGCMVPLFLLLVSQKQWVPQPLYSDKVFVN